jgi:PleD family two-component response regulator
MTSQFESPIELSPAIAFHIRKLLRLNLDRLVTLKGDKVGTEQFNDLQALLQRLHGDPGAIAPAIQQLESLTLEHQTLSSQGAKSRQDRIRAEQQIFELLGFKLSEDIHQGRILVVDDLPDNLRLLTAALTKQGYEVCSAINGTLALNSAKDLTPDLILLDVMMPQMDGYTVCRNLKADPITRDIPVMFVSAMNESLDKIKAFGLGAVDYVTKPFHIEEVFARIEHQLSIRSLKKRLEEQNLRLQQELQERKQLEERYRHILHQIQQLGMDRLINIH